MTRTRNAEYQAAHRERVARERRRLIRQNRVLERQLANVLRERDRLVTIAEERLRLLESAIRRDRAELWRLMESETTAVMADSGVPVVGAPS